jgi:hypothetical protein
MAHMLISDSYMLQARGIFFWTRRTVEPKCASLDFSLLREQLQLSAIPCPTPSKLNCSHTVSISTVDKGVIGSGTKSRMQTRQCPTQASEG